MRYIVVTAERKPAVVHRGTRLASGILLYLALSLLLSPAVMARQNALTRIRGSVVDRSGAPVPRALVEVRNPSGKVAAQCITDALGDFALEVPAGRYTVDATVSGLAPLRDYPVDAGPDTARVILKLEVPSIEEHIIVTATRTEAPLAQVGSSTTIIRGDELVRDGIDSVADALRRVAGLEVVQNGAPGQLASLFMRGGESDYTKVLIDGIPVNEPGGSFNFAELSTSGIDRIEVVRGPQSALFGSDAMSGVIQIFTRRGRTEGLSPRPRVAVEGGSFHTLRYEGGLEGKGERLDYAASFARIDTDNHVLNGSYNNATITGNLGFRLSPKRRLRAVFRSDAGRAGVPGQWGFYRPDSDAAYRHREIAGGITFTNFTSTSWTQTVSYTISDARRLSEDTVDTGTYLASYRDRISPFTFFDFPYRTLNQSRRQKLDVQTELSLPHAHLLTAGAGFERETGAVGDPASNPTSAARNNFGGFVQDEWILNKRLFATAGVRLEHNESFGFSAVPRLSLAWHARRPIAGEFLGLTKIKANFGLGIKEPTLVESFSQSPFFLGNPNLKAERSASYDVGIEQQLGSGGDMVEVTFFDSRYRNQIGFVTTDVTTFAGTFFNLAKTRARGIEAGFRKSLGSGFEVAAAYTFLDSRVLENPAASDPVFNPGRELFRRPRHSGFLDLKWKPGRWTFGATGSVTGARLDSDFLGLDLSRNPAFGVLDLLVSFRLMSGTSVFVVVDNALDRKYMESFGYPALPARFRIGLSTGF